MNPTIIFKAVDNIKMYLKIIWVRG